MKKVFEIEEGDTLIQTAWLSSAIYKKGTGMVELEFSPRLKPYMLRLNTVFTQYKLANILTMKSKYSPRIYEILKCNEFKKQGYIEIEINDFKKLLNTDNVYPRFFDFKRRVIEQAQKELKKMSDISFDFEEIKTGRTVTSLKFYIKANKKPIDEVCATIEGKPPTKGNKAPCEDIDAIKTIFKGNIEGLEAKTLLDTAKGDINIIKEKYALAQNVSKIDNIVGWVLKAIKKDYQAPKSMLKADNFNNYEQRTYDYNDLEKKLLGWENNEDTGE
jgi:plasmid replication initiation protein